MFFNNYNALILWVDGNRGNLIEVEKIDVPVELKETYWSELASIDDRQSYIDEKSGGGIHTFLVLVPPHSYYEVLFIPWLYVLSSLDLACH